jgi:hypothetical protein
MIMDASLLFSDSQAITATAASTNVVDLGATGTIYGAGAAIVRDIGPGERAPLVVTVTETFNTLTSLTISIETDDNSGFSSATTVWTSPAYTLAQLAIGAKYLLPDVIPVGVNERYVRLKYTVGGSNPTLGKITAGVVMDRQTA